MQINKNNLEQHQIKINKTNRTVLLQVNKNKEVNKNKQ